jgi:uncharacterized protein YdhG (YjbR/CyaY superfamily)
MATEAGPGRPKFASVEEYLAALTPEQRASIDLLRAAIRKGLPTDAQEVISYQIIGYRVGKGRPVVFVAAFADHFSVYPYTERVREELGAEVEPYVAGKGTLKFPAGEPLPLAMVTRVARILVAGARETSK